MSATLPDESAGKASELVLVKLKAKANLLLALLLQCNQEVEHCKEEGDRHRRQAELQGQESDRHRREAEMRGRETDRLIKELEQRNMDAERRDRDIGELTRNLELANGRLIIAQQRCAQAENAYALIVNSRSWRITAPMRAVGRLLISRGRN